MIHKKYCLDIIVALLLLILPSQRTFFEFEIKEPVWNVCLRGIGCVLSLDLDDELCEWLVFCSDVCGCLAFCSGVALDTFIYNLHEHVLTETPYIFCGHFQG